MGQKKVKNAINNNQEFLMQTIKGHKNEINSIVISSDRKYIVSSSEDDSIKIWEFSTGKVIKTIKLKKAFLLSVAISSDGRSLISGHMDGAKVWSFSGKLLMETEFIITTVWSFTISPKGNQIILGCKNGLVKTYDFKRGNHLSTVKGPGGIVYSLAVSPDGKFLVNGMDDNNINVWDLSTVMQPRHPKNALISPAVLKRLRGHSSSIKSVIFSPDGRFIISGSNDKTIKIWDPYDVYSDDWLVRTLEGHTSEVFSLAVSPDGNYIVSGSGDNTIKIWDLSTGSLLKSLDAHIDSVKSLCFSPAGKYLLSGGGDQDKTLKLWDFLKIKTDFKK